MTITELVQIFLEEDDPPSAWALIEASVHLSTRGKRFNASFRDETGRQVWRTTGLTDRAAALALARQWEEEARRIRAAQGDLAKKPTIRVRHGSGKSESGPFTEREIALLLGISERAVREIQRRAIAKLRRHPALRALWREWETGEVEESVGVTTGGWHLDPFEIAAVYALAQTPEERLVLRKLIGMIA
jgi:Sigma-70, region 4